MTEFWQPIVECLRSEVTEYGRLIQLFEEQQALLFRRDAGGVLRVTGEIDEQADVLLDSRKKREAAAGEFARGKGLAGPPTLGALLPHVSEDARPLLRALVTDVNRAAGRLRRVSRHNRLFLIRTIENNQELLRRLRPGSVSKVYNPNGNITLSSARGAAAFAAQG